MNTSMPPGRPHPAFREAFWVWLKIGLLGFGGPAGQIALMHRLLVEEKKWISEDRFLEGLNFCMLLPGPEAQQLATYIGWHLHKTRGGVMAGILFILPGALVILILSIFYALYAGHSLVDGAFFGIKAAIIAVVIDALRRMARRALNGRLMLGIAVLAFAGIFFFNIPFPLIVLGAGLIGFTAARRWPYLKGLPKPAPIPAASDDGAVPFKSGLRAATVCLLLWALPIAGLYISLGPDHVFTQEAAFFSKMAVVTFGGAYAALAYVAQQAVDHFAWLSTAQMVDGLGLAETTPGPLVLVLQYVGFMGAYQADTGLSPLTAGTIGALIASWMTFVPCFLWIFLGAPLIEKMRHAAALQAALAAITAAVVGVILNLALWFGAHVMFRQVGRLDQGPVHTILPNPASLDIGALVIALSALILMTRFRLGMVPTLGLAALAGLTLSLS